MAALQLTTLTGAQPAKEHHMAHNLNFRSDGVAAFYSLRESPWHKLGTVVDKPLTDPDIIRTAGLDWDVESRPLYTADCDAVSSHVANVRSDTRAILGIVSTEYQPVQNAQLFDWLREAAGIHPMTLETAGALGEGETTWALARIPSLNAAIGQDESQGYMLIANAHDGTRSVMIRPTVVRVVCANTMAMAVGNGRLAKRGLATGFNVRHRGDTKAALEDIAQAYRGAADAWDIQTKEAAALAARRSTADSLLAITRAAFPIRKDEQGNEGDRARAIREAREMRIASIRQGATCNVQGTAGSLYADAQAVTEYADHDARGGERSRFRSSQFGGSLEQAKARAWGEALALV